MKKIKLDLDKLVVDSFEVAPALDAPGTVQGYLITENTRRACSCAASCDGTCYATCDTCDASCAGTCAATCGATCQTCAGQYTCNESCGGTCDFSCGDSCFGPSCFDSCTCPV